MKPNITPAPPMRPTATVYGVEALATVPLFRDREAYLRFTGEQAPPFDPSKPVKKWYATVSGGFKYQSYNIKNNPPTLVETTLSEAEAATVNLPGRFVYPPYTPAPSGAYFMLNGEKQYLPPGQLCTSAEATTLAGELKEAGWPVAGVVQIDRAGMFAIGYDANEPRRIFQLQMGGSDGSTNNTHNLGALFTDRQSGGVGAPGRWTSPKDGHMPDWLPDPVREVVSVSAAEVPVPSRQLESGEQWQALPFGVQILNTSTAEGQTEVNERQLADNVAAIRRDLTALKAFFGIA